MIIGILGLQGAGKTTYAVYLSRFYESNNVKLYTNMELDGMKSITDFSEIPFNRKPKVLLIDEAMFTFDSRNFSSKDNKLFTKFLAYLRKINCTLIWITHFYNMIEKRLREQTNYVFLLKKVSNVCSKVMLLDCITLRENTFYFSRSKDMYDFIKFTLENSYSMPNIVETKGLSRLKEFG